MWDLEKNVKLLELYGHTGRVSSLAWSNNLLASGSRDRNILLRDTRMDSRNII